jgi:hypothetical protein
MDINNTNKFTWFLLATLLINISVIQISSAKTSVPSRNVLSKFSAVDSEDSLIGQLFFRYPVQYIWNYPNVSSNIIFIYVRPIGMVGTTVNADEIFRLPESISAQKDFSGIIDKIEYEGTILDGGFVIIHLNGNYVHSVHQGDKFESVAIVIHKNIPKGSINSEKLELIEEK